MKLEAKDRPKGKKCDSKKIRRAGNIPAILYSRGKAGEPVEISGAAFGTVLRNMPKGGLATTIFTLVKDGKDRKAIVKEIQYHRTRYDILHLDFEELHSGAMVKVKVPLRFEGVADCVGIKLGGVLRPVIRQVRVTCPSDKIPVEFTVDIRALAINGTKRLKDIDFPEEVVPLVDLNQVAVVIAKR